MRVHGFGAVVVASALVLSACADDGDTTDGDAAAAGVAASATDGDGDGDGDDGAGDGVAASGGEGADVLNELIARAQAATYEVTYLVPSPDGPVEFTLAHSGEATAILFEGGHVIQTAAQVVTCAEGQCLVVPPGMIELDTLMGGMMGTVGISLALNDGTVLAAGVDVELVEDTIAGRAAVCTTLNPSDFADVVADQDLPDGEYTACVDAETGVMLKVTSPVDDEGFEAIAFSTDPDPELFTPPHPPQQPGG